MSEEAAKRAIEFLVRCCYENAGYEVTKITVRKKTPDEEKRIPFSMIDPGYIPTK
ncbi:hypothetical protein [Oscillibacter sp.]|uniref:hypothetical protein n=1 Tax=Oscillibacter sp. TaxID=1945593 RepID=UPI002898CB22|nr:hypothetical protein [Oscillibacter sp.]